LYVAADYDLSHYSFSGPPPGWEGPPPGKGSEIFVGKVPRDCYEDELVPVSLVFVAKRTSAKLASVQ
jgi:hypothetical protein